MSNRPYIELKNEELIKLLQDEQANPCALVELAFELTKRSKISKKKKYKHLLFISKRLHEIRYDEEAPLLTKEIARRGIYIDFECYRDEEPTLLGILLEGNFEQVVFLEDLKPAVRASNLEFAYLESAIADILDLATRECRRIITYSEYDLNKIKEYTNLGKNVEYFYTNARKIADIWQKEYLESKEINNSLKSVAEKIGKPYPKYLLKKNPTKIIRKIKKALSREQEFAKLPDDAKKDWGNLLEYNRYDCWVMQEFLVHVSNQANGFS
jgi:hypothetical protein